MKPSIRLFAPVLLLACLPAMAESADTADVNRLGYAETTFQERQINQFEQYVSLLKDNYDVSITKPESFSVIDLRGRDDIGKNNINSNWHGVGHDMRHIIARTAIEADNEDAAFIYPRHSYFKAMLPPLRAAKDFEFELRNSRDNMEFDVTPLLTIIAEDDMSQYANADTAVIYEFDFQNKFLGRYQHCIGIYLQKAAHPALLLKIALNDKGYEKKDDYIRLMLDNIRYGDSPNKLLVYNENAIKGTPSEFNFPTHNHKCSGILPSINEETLAELNRRKAWLEAHGMEDVPKVSDEVLERLNNYYAGRKQREAETDSIVTADIPENQKVYPGHVLERRPEFPGEHPYTAQNKWIKKNLKYPSDAKKKGIQGSVIANFTVMPDGSIEDIDIERANPDLPSFKKEAVRLIKSMPKWIPGKYDGKDVCARSYVYISFILPPEDRAKIAAKVKASDPEVEYDARKITVNSEFPGGQEALDKWVEDNIVYTDEIIEYFKDNKDRIRNSPVVSVQCNIDRDGSIINPKLFINQGPLSVEALRLLEKMPKWIPAFINENPVRSYQNINIKFKLPEGK